MNIEKLSIFSGFIALCAGCSAQGGDASGVGATSQPLAAAAPVWTIVETPNAGSEDNVLAAVSGSSPDDVWAVGQHAADADPNMTLSLALHFDGNAWSVVDTPNQGAEP